MTGNWKVGRGRDWRPHVPCRGLFSGNPGTSLEEKKLNIEFYLANLGEWGEGVGGGGTWTGFCWACATCISEPPPNYSLFLVYFVITFGQITFLLLKSRKSATPFYYFF